MSSTFRNTTLTAVAALALTACNGGRDSEAAAGASAGDTAQMAMADMKSMSGMGSSTMMEQMQSHMRMMDGTGADSLQAMLALHRQMVANMISQFGSEMREMNMKADAEWTASIDSLRQDNIQMPGMSASELRTFMPGHSARVSRIMEMHRAMMAKM
jgi:hypothetical protein